LAEEGGRGAEEIVLSPAKYLKWGTERNTSSKKQEVIQGDEEKRPQNKLSAERLRRTSTEYDVGGSCRKQERAGAVSNYAKIKEREGQIIYKQQKNLDHRKRNRWRTKVTSGKGGRQIQSGAKACPLN